MLAALAAAMVAPSLCADAPPSAPAIWPSQHWQGSRIALAELEADAQHHPCVLGVVLELHASCDGMSEDDSVRLALSLTNCHRMQSGRNPHPCNANDPVATCISPLAMTEAEFGVFTSFRLKVDSICHFVALEATQHRADAATQLLIRGSARTAEAVTSLSNDLDGVSERMEFSSRVMVSAVEGARDKALLSIESLRGETEGVSSQLKSVLESSLLALDRHAALAEQQTSMRDDVHNASLMLSAAMDDHALSMQRGWHEGLALLKAEIQELVWAAIHAEQQGMQSLHTVCYFVASCALGWALTSASRTRAARSVWFALLLLQWALEREFLASLAGYGCALSPSGLWACRRAIVACGCMSVIYAACRYMDPESLMQEKLNTHGTALQEHGGLLRELQREQSAMHDDLSKCLASLASTPHRLQSVAEPHARTRLFDGAVTQQLAVPSRAKRTVGAAVGGSAPSGDYRAKSAASATHVDINMSYRELQSELKRRGLKAQGNMQALRMRLLQSSALGDAME